MFDAVSLALPPIAAIGPVTNFAPDEEIYAEGERAGALYRVVFGVVRVYRLLADGRRQICAFNMAGDVFGFEATPERHVFADAVNAVGLSRLRPDTNDRLRLALSSLNRAHDHLLTIGRNDASGRVAAFLLDMADRQGTSGAVDLPMSRLDIADYLGLTIETVSRVFTRLREQDVIRLTSTRHVELRNPGRLEALTF